MNRSLNRWFAAVLVVAAMGVSGCAYNPLHGQNLGASLQADFKGFTTEAGALVRVEYWSWSTNAWVLLTTTHASNTAWAGVPTTTSFYQWYVYPTVPAVAFNASKQARLRALQVVGSNPVPMFMYDNAGWTCLLEHFFAETWTASNPYDMRGAGIECSDDGTGNQRAEVTVTRP